MPHALVIGHHLIWTAYGWWLPNDPRGSGSLEVRSDILRELGELHHGRKTVQPASHVVRQFYESAEPLLKHPLLSFDEGTRDQIGQAFAEVMQEQRYTCYACAIMPDHVHLAIRKHKHSAEEMIEALKVASVARLREYDAAFSGRPLWADGSGWKVFLDHPDDMRRVIEYIRRNPMKAGLAEQLWGFVMNYDGWPLHPGHSPNSPYARGLRELGRYP